MSNGARGESADEPQWPSPDLLRQRFELSQPSHPIRTSSHAHRISIEERSVDHLSRSDESGIYREVGRGAVECHLRAMPTLSRTMDPDTTWTPEIMLGHTR
jgi:hypothetical protein